MPIDAQKGRFQRFIFVEAGWAQRQLAGLASDVVKAGNRVARGHGQGKGKGAVAAHTNSARSSTRSSNETGYTPQRPSREHLAADP